MTYFELVNKLLYGLLATRKIFGRGRHCCQLEKDKLKLPVLHGNKGRPHWNADTDIMQRGDSQMDFFGASQL